MASLATRKISFEKPDVFSNCALLLYLVVTLSDFFRIKCKIFQSAEIEHSPFINVHFFLKLFLLKVKTWGSCSRCVYNLYFSIDI